MDISDPFFAFAWIYLGGSGFSCSTACEATGDCSDAADVNDDGGIDISDGMYSYRYMFRGGPLPLAPFPACGADPTADALPGAGAGGGGPRFADLTLGFEPTSEVVLGLPGEVKTIQLFATLRTTSNTSTEGPEAWSFGLTTDQGAFEEITTRGVHVSSVFEESPGELIDPYDLDLEDSMFSWSQLIEEPEGAEPMKAVSVVALHGSKLMVLQPSGTARIAAVRIRVTIPEEGCVPLTVNYANGLQGAGQRVATVVSMQGWPQVPTLTPLPIYLCAKPPDLRVPGDCNEDAFLDISDATCLLGVLFLGRPPVFPCGSGLPDDPGNLALLDWQADGEIDISDASAQLSFLFLGGGPHPLSVPGNELRACAPVPGCQAGPRCD